MNFLILIAIVLFCIAAGQIMKIFELSSAMRGEKQWVVTEKDNRLNGRLMLWFLIAFFGFCIWQFFKYKDKLLPVAASEVGVEIDWLLNFNFVIIIFVFFVTNACLFWFAYKYYGRTSNKATYYPENHKLELLWTIVPGIVLAVIIFLGLKSWTKITREPDGEEYMLVELYPKQFDWTARYSGDDNTLGFANYKFIQPGANELGVDSTDEKSFDDFLVVTGQELHLRKGTRVKFVFRSRDVIHSAFFPHFRQQMNCVPGMTTQLHFVPTITTDSMKMITNDPNFDYVLLCNKICGASHYNMQMKIVVDEPDKFNEWYKEAKKKVVFAGKMKGEKEEQPQKEMLQVTDSVKKDTVNNANKPETDTAKGGSHQ